jgi:hypothetical protein
MMQSFITLVFGVAGALTVTAATVPLYINNSAVNSPPDPAPQIDATAFLNRSIFNVNAPFFGTIPYQTLNTRFFTNAASGIISGTPGYRFDYFHDSTRDRMSWWVNNGSISAGSWLLASADNIISTGPLAAGPAGLIRLEGQNINLTRNGLRTGQTTNVVFGGGFTSFGTNYSSPPGVSDVYWGSGTNNTLNGMGPPMVLNQGNFNWPFVISPPHQVVFNFGGFLFTNLTTVGGFGYGAFVYTNRTSASNYTIQIAFLPTNNFDTNLSTDVRFFTPGENGGADIAVEFKLRDFDIASQTFQTNAIYLVDHSGFATNIILARPFFGGTPNRRPNTYELFRFTPFEFSFGTPNNALYTDTLISNPTYASNAVTALYAAYGAQIASPTLTNGALPGASISDPTNAPGRIEIIGNSVNLDQTRIRAESTVIIKANELGGGKVARVDAPYLHYDLGSSLPELVISNLAPTTVRRLFGQINAWSAVWDNVQVTATETNFIKFHVLIVDNFLQTLTPVFLNDFAARANHLTIRDSLTVRRNVRINSPGLNIAGGLTFPPGAEWSHTNVQGLVNLTNSGVINVAQSAFVGADPAPPLANYVNSGTNSAASHDIRASYLENSGCIVANIGSLTVEADTINLLGKPTILFTNVFTNVFFDPFTSVFVTNVATNVLTNSFGAKLAASSDLTLTAGGILASNSYLIADAGALILSASESFVDAGPLATNEWRAGAGVRMLTLPAVSDLLGTRITSRVAPFAEASHVWSGADFKATPLGFNNNLALGKLTLDAGEFSLMTFASPTGAKCALYVDYLELLNNATNYNTALQIDESLTVYFANANVSPGKLDGRHGGRLRWVKTFAGPLSSTNITYPSGRTYTFNSALVSDKDLDSDGDGIVNGDDPTPIYSEDHIDLRVALTTAPARRAVISWFALGGSTSEVEYKTSFNSSNWQSLSVVNSGASAERLTVTDPIPNTVQQRFYRVRVYPPPL